MLNTDNKNIIFDHNYQRLKRSVLFCLLLLLLPFIVSAQKKCTVTNQTFQSGEYLNYVINYNWGAIWLTTGEVGFSATTKDLNGRKVYHFMGIGGTYQKYDWFFKVRDKYESYADTTTLRPIRFIREVNEGSNYAKDDYVFSNLKNKIYSSSQRNKKNVKQDSITINSCTNDVLTAIYYARCLDFSSYKPNDTIPITFVLDAEVYFSYIIYLGKEVINSELLGNVRCIKFSPKLIKGTIFKEGAGMTVWVTDDMNKIPVYVETPIIVGTIKVNLNKYSGLRNKIECIVPK
ncbi:MAG: DUF3108 domain-containing protein [Bacteroidetes bacterium]|nr:DUF3108 domain-containing protein [Bacteroidota bacterium]